MVGALSHDVGDVREVEIELRMQGPWGGDTGLSDKSTSRRLGGFRRCRA